MIDSRKSTTFTMVISRELKEKIIREAERQQRSQANLVSFILREYFERNGEGK